MASEAAWGQTTVALAQEMSGHMEAGELIDLGYAVSLEVVDELSEVRAVGHTGVRGQTAFDGQISEE